MAWNRIVLILSFLISSYTFTEAQTFRCFVSFKDKNNSTFSLSKPEEFLSQRAIDRRIRQHISIVESDLPVCSVYIQEVLSISGTNKLRSSKWLNGILLVLTDTSVLQQLRNLAYVKEVILFKTPQTSSLKPMELEKAEEVRWQIEIEEFYGQAYNQIALHQGQHLHRMGYRAAGMVIAVIDAGFPNVNSLAAFSELQSGNRILGVYDFINMDNDISDQLHFHGTAVLSCMATNLPGSYVGTAPDASYWLFVSEDVSQESLIEEYNWAIAAEFADSVGADLINSSLGYTRFDDSTTDHTYADLDGNTTPITIAADLAASKGILVFNSAGNYGTNDWFHIGAPADADSIVAVGAIDGNGLYAPFSSKGPSADGRVKPNLAAKGFGSALVWVDGSFITGNGTSFSSPTLAGLAACLWQAFPTKSNMEIISALHSSASQYEHPDSLMGYGIPDLFKAFQLLGGVPDFTLFEEQLLSLYPNPFSNSLVLEYYSVGENEMSIELVDVNGKVFYTENFVLFSDRLNRINCTDIPQDLSAGMYFLKLKTSKNQLVKKIMRY